MTTWSKRIFLAGLVFFGVGFSALVLFLLFDQDFLLLLFGIGTYGAVFLFLIVGKMREKIEERRQEHAVQEE